MILALPSQLPKSAMKTRKQAKTTRLAKSKEFVESKDDDDSLTQPVSGGVPMVILPQLSACVARTSGSPRSPRAPKKKPFGPAMAISGKLPEVIRPPQPTPATLAVAPPVIDTSDILIPGPMKQPLPGLPQDGMALRNSVGQEDRQPLESGTTAEMLSRGPGPKLLPKLPPKLRPPHNPQAKLVVNLVALPALPVKLLFDPKGFLDQAQGSEERKYHEKLLKTLTPTAQPEMNLYTGLSAVKTPKVQTRGRSKTVTAIKAPTPAPARVAPLTSGVSRSALDVPMPDLHAMAMAIQDGAARVTILEARVAEQDGMELTPLKLEDPSAIEGLMFEPGQLEPEGPQMSGEGVMFEPSQVEPEGPQMSGEGVMFEPSQVEPDGPQMSGDIVDPDDPGNLVPEYNSVDEMDIEVKGEGSGEE
ncbi:uncharacterized protein HD556DRAFT_1304068 [Suillus plorans]|uniref:Uncharacterized protein n=1 Tax=Suillus plorans TaxID=116603 RepID=A0A9P7J4K2_9AGAM|nr:uncharacterized protein HD556DRAFT_1304068 [Suillus plorans]KAG1802802.1 hypothetical protein HD556DRAFT_1304068 [Suillus plorans]